MRRTHYRLEAASQWLIREQCIEIHRDLGHPNAVALRRQTGVQICQRLRVIQPGAFRHKALDQLQHPIGAVDESAQHFAGVGVLGAIAALIQKPFGPRGVLGRRQIKKGKKIARLIVSSRLLELGFPLGIDQG